MTSTSTSVVEHLSRTPAAPLTGLVDRYVGYRMTGFSPGVHAGLPSTSLTFIISFDQPIDLAVMPDAAQAPERLWAMVSGLHSSPAQIRHDGNQHGLQLDVTPLGARLLFGMPAGALSHTVVSLSDAMGRRAAELVERLGATSDWSARFDVLDRVLVELATTHDGDRRAATRTELRWAWRQICAAHGDVAVAALADELGWSRRHLGGQFRDEYGLTPSTAARVARFQRAQRLLKRPDRPSLADAALMCGYSDQAHMTREWTRLAGSSPGVWLRDEEFPSVQDDGSAPSSE